MTPNHSSLLVLLLVALWALLVICHPIQDETQRLSEAMNELEDSFPGIIQQIYWQPRQLAEHLFKSGQQSEGKELINMAQVSAVIEVVKYAIRVKSISKVGKMITTRFVPQKDDSKILDKKLQITMRSEILSALVSRALLRSAADSDRYTAYNWGWLHKLIEHNLPRQKEPAFKKLALDSYQQLVKLDLDMKRANQEFETKFRAALKAMHIDELQAVNIVAVLDRIIDEALEFTQRASASIDQTRYNTRPLFYSDDSVKEAVDELVDDELIGSFSEIEGVYKVTPEDQASVTKQDINNLMQKVVQ